MCNYAPVNDLCSGAIEITEGTHLIDNNYACVTEGYTIPAAPGAVQGSCYSAESGWCLIDYEPEVEYDIFYSFTTPSDPTEITIEIFDDPNAVQFGDLNSQMALFSDCGGTLIKANDDKSENDNQAKLTFDCDELTPNTSYIILIDAMFNGVGTALFRTKFWRCLY